MVSKSTSNRLSVLEISFISTQRQILPSSSSFRNARAHTEVRPEVWRSELTKTTLLLSQSLSSKSHNFLESKSESSSISFATNISIPSERCSSSFLILSGTNGG